MRWVWVGGESVSLGTLVAFVILIVVALLGFMRMIDVPAALLIAAVCALKL